MQNGKAVGPDGIPVEVWKSLGEEDVDMLLDLLQNIFEQEKMSEERKMSEEWKDSVIVPIFKESIQDCGNYRGIKMISHTTEDLGKNNRQKTERGDKHTRRRAVRFHAEQRDN